MFIGIDDTDSQNGMCTTFLATELIKEFSDYHLVDYPRLVRLNPNVPWKTRGNGAIALQFGKVGEKKETIGRNKKDICVHDTGGDLAVDKNDIKRVKAVIERWAELQDDNTNPGLLVSDDRPPRELYEKGVKEIVEMEDVLNILGDMDGRTLYDGYGNARGVIGAACALSWTPQDFTYEVIAYREEDKWGTDRNISEEDVKELDRRTVNTFDNYDYQECEQEIAPNSPCPVLYGVRGDDRVELQKAHDIVGGERPERWITFLSNQGTDDHIQQRDIAEVEPWISVRISGEVSTEPEIHEGGHLFFDVKGDRCEITAAAYEPTKGFREIAGSLIPGDRVELWGGIRKEPVTLNIEKMKIESLAENKVKTGNPRCPECGKSMSSIGKDAGFRCRKCSTRASESDIKTKILKRRIEEGWYETPVTARRHLSKPLKRMKG